MSFLSQIRGFVRALRRKGNDPVRHGGHSLARAMRDSTHVRGGGMGGGMGLSRGSTEAQEKIVSEGHEQYDKSFDKD